MLWFAFILLSLSYWKQRGARTAAQYVGCDLLSFYYLCRTGNNIRERLTGQIPVVICFHFTIFVVLETTLPHGTGINIGLWFAFILLSLSYWKQPYSLMLLAHSVVICFHFTIFVVLETTMTSLNLSLSTLWFAFILLSLSYWKQRRPRPPTTVVGCDLLSFYYLCRTGNNVNWSNCS